MIKNLAANSALVAIVVIAVTEILALLRGLLQHTEKTVSADRASTLSTSPLIVESSSPEPVRHRASTHPNRRAGLPSRRQKIFKLSDAANNAEGRERRVMRGRRASDFITAA